MTDLRIVFMGSPDFAIPTLQVLTEHYSVDAVVTQPDRPSGRGRVPKPSDVKRFALDNGIPVLEPDKASSEESISTLSDISPDLIVVAAYGQLLRQNVLDIPRFGCLNVHASLLPRWRGASPIQAAILHGDKKSGVTIMKMERGLDTGPILSQSEIPLTDTMTGGALFSILAELGAQLLIPTINAYTAGNITPIPQQDSLSTYAPMIKKSDGLLDFKNTAHQLAAQIRAYEPWPGSHFFYEGRRIVVRAAHVEASGSTNTGTIVLQGGFPAAACSEGLLVLDTIQPSGKKPMSGDAFLHGTKEFIGANILNPAEH